MQVGIQLQMVPFIRGNPSSGSVSSIESSDNLKAKQHFCFPSVKDMRIRIKLRNAFVSGLFLLFILVLYLGLTLSHEISKEFGIFLLMVLLMTAMFFAHCCIRATMLIFKPTLVARDRRQRQSQNNSNNNSGAGNGSSGTNPSGIRTRRIRIRRTPSNASDPGLTNLTHPIPVQMVNDDLYMDTLGLIDEESLSGTQERHGLPNNQNEVDRDALKTPPPAYGIWRSSARADPNLLYWQRTDHALGESIEVRSFLGSSSDGLHGSEMSIPPPPDYSSPLPTSQGLSPHANMINQQQQSQPYWGPRQQLQRQQDQRQSRSRSDLRRGRSRRRQNTSQTFFSPIQEEFEGEGLSRRTIDGVLHNDEPPSFSFPGVWTGGEPSSQVTSVDDAQLEEEDRAGRRRPPSYDILLLQGHATAALEFGAESQNASTAEHGNSFLLSPTSEAGGMGRAL
jgi:hypothetical protein